VKLVLDIETDLKQSVIWLVVTKRLDTGEIECHTESSTLKPLIEAADLIIGHNAINFDLFHLERLWKIPTMSKRCYDTLILSRLARPDRPGGHSLENWGKILNFPKGSFNDFDSGLSPEMIHYCKQDVELTERVYLKVAEELREFSERSVELELAVARIIGEQERNGFQLDLVQCLTLLTTVKEEMATLEEEFTEIVPPNIKQLKTKVKQIPFNPNSRQQIATFLLSQGWKPGKFTDTGKPVVDESSLKGFDHPVAKKFERYLMLQKRASQVDSWLEAAGPDGVVHGKVITNGAITGRMTHHSPNMAQVPSVGSPFGAECRACWVAKKGYTLVGADLSGIELRCLAHYMKDEEYTKELLNGDIHTRNQKAAGLPTRAIAKTFCYAILYGAGPAKVGSIIGGTAEEGKEAIDTFLSNTPALKSLVERVRKYAKKGWLPGLDGRRVWVRSEHSALNTLLQSAGAIVAKQWVIQAEANFVKNGLAYKPVACVHDEIEVEVLGKEVGKTAGELLVYSAKEAGQLLGFRVPIDAEFKIGESWADVH
jgi:DNA polymerase I-like protein with 3'-5' exonuclease and polymerase domains